MRRIISTPILICLIMLATSIYYMFHIKYQVRNLYNDVFALEKQIIQEQESIKVLGAELAYLNQPERLKSIAKKFLPHFAPIKVSQLNPQLKHNDYNQAAFVETGKEFKSNLKIKVVNYKKGN